VLVTMTWMQGGDAVDWNAFFRDLTRKIIEEFIPITLGFLLSSVLLGRYLHHKQRLADSESTDQIQTAMNRVVRQALIDQQRNMLGSSMYETFDDIDWSEQLKEARQLVVVVHYLDSWLRRAEPALRGLIDRGGRVSVIVPDAERGQVVDAIASRFPDRSREEILEKMRGTKRRIVGSCGAIDGEQIDVISVPNMIWYSAFCIDDRWLYLSPFEHFRGNRIRSPVAHIDLEFYKGIAVWFRNECSHLRSSIAPGVGG